MIVRQWFSFDDVESRNYEVCITDVKVHDSPKRDVTFYSVAGRNGDILFDQKRFSNVDVTYSAAIYKNVEQNLNGLKVALYSRSGYFRLTDTIHPEEFRLAALQKAISVDVPKYNGPATFDIVFNCKPQRYLFSGLETLSFTSPGSINNAYLTALPLIKVYGSGDGQISVGGTVVQLIGQTDPITLDCDIQDAYYETGDGILENRNNQISAPTFPQLLPGVNAVSWSGGVARLEITPRWWTL